MTNGSDDDRNDPANTLRSVGSTLGGWAKRVGKAITEATGPQHPEEVVRALGQAHDLRRSGQYAAAYERLQTQLKARPGDPSLLLSLALTIVEQALVTPDRADVLHLFAEGLGKRSERSPAGPLVEATLHLLRREFDASLDALRRARKLIDELTGSLQPETRFVYHLLTTLAQGRRGRHERALLELHKTRARLPEGTRGPLRQLLLAEGAQVALAAESIDEAIAWLGSETEPPEGSEPDASARTARAYLALALAGRARRPRRDPGAHGRLAGRRARLGRRDLLRKRRRGDEYAAARTHAAADPHQSETQSAAQTRPGAPWQGVDGVRRRRRRRAKHRGGPEQKREGVPSRAA